MIACKRIIYNLFLGGTTRRRGARIFAKFLYHPCKILLPCSFNRMVQREGHVIYRDPREGVFDTIEVISKMIAFVKFLLVLKL